MDIDDDVVTAIYTETLEDGVELEPVMVFHGLGKMRMVLWGDWYKQSNSSIIGEQIQ